MIPLLRKNLIFFLLLNFNLHAQVTLTNNNLKVNNTVITNNTIGFNSNQSLDISLTVQLETADNSINNTFGNLFLYYKKSENDSPTQVGYQSIVFVQNIPKTNFISNALFTSIILYKNTFFASGGILYAEYKNNNNNTYQSNKISITGGSLTTTPTPPPSTNQSIATQNLKYSDNFPIVNSKLFVTADTSTYFDVDVYMAQNESNNSTINIYAYEEGGSKRILLKSVFIGGFINSYFLVKDIKVNPTDLDFTKTYVLKVEKRKYSSDLSTYSSIIDNLYKDNKAINIILAKPISYNTIADNQSLSSEQISKPFTSLSPWVDYTIPCNRRGCIPTYDRRDVTVFKWQIKTQNSDWSDIYGETQKDYSPNKSFTENTYYRRVAFYNDGQYNLSNIISITLNNQSFENTICCNQDLPLTTSQPKEITGNIPTLSNFTYQWQICTQPSDTTPLWSDITNATTQNYQHTFTQAASRWTLITAFRRLIKTNTFVTSTSNTITITRSRTSPQTEINPPIRRDGTTNPRSKPSTSKVILNETNNEAIENETENIDIYPNPVFNSFFIKGSTNISNINFFDSSGGKINLEKKQVSENLIEVDATKLSSGIFILKIDNSTYSKKIIKK